MIKKYSSKLSALMLAVLGLLLAGVHQASAVVTDFTDVTDVVTAEVGAFKGIVIAIAAVGILVTVAFVLWSIVKKSLGKSH